jgi:polyisoprenoid-binding protein YceI
LSAVPIPPGRYTLGPGDGTLTVRTGKTGAASKAGHNLVIEVTAWQATLDLPDGPGERSVALTADPRSLRVRDGSGGVQALGDDDKAGIARTIDAEVLKGSAITFRSRRIEAGPDGTGLCVEGDLDLVGASRPVAFHLDAGADGRITGSAVLRQTDWGIKPYSTLFGTLKVADDVEVAVDARLPAT